jgi:glycerate kinase
MAVAERAPAAAALPAAVLVAAGAFGSHLPAERVAAALARGLRAGGREQVDPCPVAQGAGLRELLVALDFDARMRGSRALIVAEPRLERATLERTAAFELATRARQAGVPCYAVAARNELNAFDARMLDLQLILLASSTRDLAAAGRELAQLL